MYRGILSGLRKHWGIFYKCILFMHRTNILIIKILMIYLLPYAYLFILIMQFYNFYTTGSFQKQRYHVCEILGGEDTLIWRRELSIALSGEILLEEAVDLSSDRLLMMMSLNLIEFKYIFRVGVTSHLFLFFNNLTIQTFS